MVLKLGTADMSKDIIAEELQPCKFVIMHLYYIILTKKTKWLPSNEFIHIREWKYRQANIKR